MLLLLPLHVLVFLGQACVDVGLAFKAVSYCAMSHFDPSYNCTASKLCQVCVTLILFAKVPGCGLHSLHIPLNTLKVRTFSSQSSSIQLALIGSRIEFSQSRAAGTVWVVQCFIC